MPLHDEQGQGRPGCEHEFHLNETIGRSKNASKAACQRLPHKAIPRKMIRCLAMNKANQLDLFPVKGGVSSYHSPCMMLSQMNLDYKKDCTVPFGAHVQANHETVKMNSNVTRILDAICMRPAQNQQGGHELTMDLNSGKLTTRNIVHKIPVTDVVIKAVETMACAQGFKSLKFENRHGVIFHDADWIAGVDHDDNADDKEEDYDEDHHHVNEDDHAKEELEEQEEIDPDEVEGVMREDANPNTHEEEEPDNPLEEPHDQGDTNVASKGDEEESHATESSTR
jgi:hypothetical protein